MKKKSFLAILLCVVMLAVSSPMWGAASELEDQVGDAEDRVNSYTEQMEAAQKLLASLRAEQDSLTDGLLELNTAVADQQAKVSALQIQAVQKEQEMEKTETELENAEQIVQDQYEEMRLRIQFLYENGVETYLELLFTSGSLAELLSRSEYISQISEYDRAMLDTYEQTVAAITAYHKQLATDEAELKALLAEAKDYEAALELLVTAQNKQLEQVAERIRQAQNDMNKTREELQEEEELLAYLEAELERQAQEILRRAQQAAIEASIAASIAESEAASREEASRAEEESKNQEQGGQKPIETPPVQTEPTQNTPTQSQPVQTNPNPGTTGDTAQTAALSILWPVPVSQRVTSYFGPRPNKPVEGVAAFHNGIDIAAPSGSDIIAVADGTVYYAGDGVAMNTQAGGNQVWLIHENGLYMTTYMHCVDTYVQAGQYVHAGDVIAGVGTTGLSTGNHLDFRVVYQGQHIDPLGALVQYR